MLHEITEILGVGESIDVSNSPSENLPEENSKEGSTEEYTNSSMVGSSPTRVEPFEKLIHVDHEYVKTPEVITDCFVEIDNTTIMTDINEDIIMDNSVDVCQEFVDLEPAQEIIVDDNSSLDQSENSNLLSNILEEVGITSEDACSTNEQNIAANLESSLHDLLEELGEFVNVQYLQDGAATSQPSNKDDNESLDQKCFDESILDVNAPLSSPLICAGTTCKTLESYKENIPMVEQTSELLSTPSQSVEPHSPGLFDLDYLPSSSPLYSDGNLDSDSNKILNSDGSQSPTSVNSMFEDHMWQESFVELFPTLSF